MKHRHAHVNEDQQLWKEIQEKVKQELGECFHVPATLIWVKFIFYFLLVVTGYGLLFVLTNPWLFVFNYVVFGWMSILFAFNFAHDLSHDAIFQQHRWNNLGFIAIYSLVGAHAEAWRERHIHSHHFAPNVEHYDTDLELSNIIRVLPNSPHKWYHRFQHVYASFAYTTYSLFWIFVKDFVVLFSSRNSFIYQLSFWSQKIFYLSYILLLPILFSAHSWPIVLIAFLLMHFIQSLFLLFTFFITHHVESTAYPAFDSEGRISTSWFKNQLVSSNDFYPFSRLANFIFGGFNNHVAHHLFPSVHHIHYPKLSRLLYQTLQSHGLEPNQTTYLGGVISHLQLLKTMSKL
jgi:linoleoyl-CoA desaturase